MRISAGLCLFFKDGTENVAEGRRTEAKLAGKRVGQLHVRLDFV